mgnify:CR=1 FL=1
MTIDDITTPAYIIDENILVHNLEILKYVEDKTGCKILLAQKAFSSYALYPLISQYISGTTASGIFEAELGHECMGKDNHVFAPAFTDEDMDKLVKICDHIIFNSIGQLMRYKEKCIRSGISIGLRINPEISTQGDNAIYDPCAYGSRLGVTIDMLNKADEEVLNGVEGLHFHTLCEQNSDALAITLKAVEDKFGHIMKNMKWINMGGGHHITRKDYDIDTLIGCVNHIKSEYNVQVYLEPGEAVALNAGYLVTEVLDKVDNGIETLILDASAACHMPDVLEMPYTPPLRGAQIIKNIKEYKDVTAGKDIQENEETGCTVVQDLGDGYAAVYGQLKELNFAKGDTPEAGQVLGYVSEPTKYYTTEGSNVYFQLKKDGKAVDPKEYLPQMAMDTLD